MTHPVLPKLKAGHNIDAFTAAGAWEVRRANALQKLSQGLSVDKVETDLSSIPDMWARPMLFEVALLDPEHPLHDRVRGEWRGLLAMVALRAVMKISKFSAQPVSIPAGEKGTAENGELKAGAGAIKNRDFLKTLGMLLPGAMLSSDTPWHSLHVFLCNGRATGITSPTTLVATAADYTNRIVTQEVPWFDGAHLQDPLPKLSPTQKSLLAGWLDNLVRQLGAHPAIDESRWDGIAGLLRSFIADLGPHESLAVRLSPESFGFPATGIFTYLDRPVEAEVEAFSHVELMHGAERSRAPRMLVFDRSIPGQWGMLPQNVTVDGAQTLASARVPEVANAEVWSTEDFFLEKLVVVTQKEAFPAARLGRNGSTLEALNTAVTPILPLNRKLLEHFSGQMLADSVRWEKSQDGVKIFLALRLTGPDAGKKGRMVEISRVYQREDIRDLDNVPILEVWPNFICDDWKAYYTCYSTEDVARTFEAEPWARGVVEPRNVPMPRELERRRYWYSEAFPEVMICRASGLSPDAPPLQMDNAGLLPLNPPQKVLRQSKTYWVGVDFGASSTTICAGTGADDSGKVELQKRKVTVCASGGSGQAQLFDFFLPGSASEMPVLSIFHDFSTVTAGGSLKAMLDGHAYLLETSEFGRDTPGLCYDLKWSSESVDRERVRAFLTQLCLQAGAELTVSGGSAAHWGFSYPTAFDSVRTGEYSAICEQVTARAAELTGLKRAGKNVKLTESEAAALYFQTKRHAARAVGTIVMDIGGSTSDISVWQGDKAVWQTSVLFAGRNIFSNFLWVHPEFLGIYLAKDAEMLPGLKARYGGNRKPFHARTDAILRYNAARIAEQLPVHAGTPLARELQTHLALGLGGLFFYMGMLLRYLTESGLYRMEVPSIYIGGNGSRVLQWLGVGHSDRIHNLYRAMFSLGAGWSDTKHFLIDVSADKEAKTEAAHGLVFAREETRGGERRDVLAGESYVVGSDLPESGGKRQMSWDNLLAPVLFTGRLGQPEKLEKLAEFLAAFRKVAAENGISYSAEGEEKHLEEARRRVGQSLARWQGKNADEVIVEPIFILALRHFLEARLGI